MQISVTWFLTNILKSSKSVFAPKRITEEGQAGIPLEGDTFRNDICGVSPKVSVVDHQACFSFICNMDQGV